MDQDTTTPDYKHFQRFSSITVVSLILLLIGFSVWKSVAEYRLTIRAAEQQTSGYAKALKEHAERAFSETDNVLQDVIEKVHGHGGIERESSRHLRDVLSRYKRSSPQIASIALINRNGTLFAHTVDSPIKEVYATDREYFVYHSTHPKEDTPFISRPFKNGLNGKWHFTLSRPVRSSSGVFDGVVAASFEMEYFQKFYGSLNLGKKGRIVMMRTDGSLIIAEPFKESDYSVDFKKSHLMRTYLPRSPKGTFHIAPGKALLEPDARIVSYESLTNFPMVAMTNVGVDEITVPWLRGTLLQGVLTLAACVTLSVLLVILLRQIRRIQEASRLQCQQQAEIASAAVAWQTTFDSVADVIWVMDLERNVLRSNKATNILFSKDSGQTPGNFCCIMAHYGHSPMDMCPFHKMLESGERANIQIAKGDCWYDISVDPIRDKNGAITGAVHIVSDITPLKQAEERAVENENHIRGLLSAIPDAIFFKDAAGKWLLVNSAGIELFSLQNIDYFGKTDVELAEMIPQRRNALLACSQTDNATWERGCLTQTEETITESNGTERIFDTIKIPMYRNDGSQDGLVIVGRDITDHRQMEIQLRQAQKMEAIGHLAGGIAHDFNNLLTPIMGYAEMAAAAIPSGDKLAPKLNGIITAAHKAKALTHQLLSFGRRQSIASEIIDINEVILSFNTILRRTIRESIRIDLVLDPEGSFIKGDRSQIEQIILNMTVNAQDAFDGSQGRINIETCKMWMDGENARMHPGMVPGEYVLLSFRDNGCGMSAEVISHIFEPFFTTKQIGHGTGLGLATVYGIVKQHNAYISVISREKEGTTFNIYFPVCAQVPLMVTPPAPSERSAVAGEATILVVEDNKMVREMVQEMLTDHGFTVLTAADPNQAIELLAHTSVQIDLLLSDVVMPGMNGPELFEQLIVQIPRLKVVFISGYPINPSMRGGRLEDGINYLQKPFTAEALLERVNQVL
ncbi:MAG: ATP-binding protein [Desulfuromonadaceae bacterium]|nr:ATP-binding protein [Desulfuromonadaceae bacterium]